MKEIIELKHTDFILNVDYNPLELDLSVWDNYLDLLCKDRYYQKEAIKTAVNYIAGKKYDSLKDLARKNFNKNSYIREAYFNEKDYINQLGLFSNKLFANIDLATATGKSFVMYGISQILLSIGIVKKVLLLCPSITIEDGLFDKFLKLSSNNELFNLIPEQYMKIRPSIINANSTILDGSICIENIHAVYDKTGSSIKDSFKNNKGENTLILNDESHHIFNNQKNSDLKKWGDFLLNSDYNFKYILGFTGTAYHNDDYFKNVIYRYSLKQAIEDGFVKNIEYISESSEIIKKEEEKFQIILQKHESNNLLYRDVLKPISIMITKDIESAISLEKRFKSFLIKHYSSNSESNISLISEDINEKILVINYTSTLKEKELLKNIDSIENKVEWVISVSMLNEGWDVKNVFQIIPMEEKAFNSKLLIAQVLGRGLRKPENLSNPKVFIMNHDSWSKNIKYLVNEILEIETKIEINNSELRKKYHFDLFNIDYDKEPYEINKKNSEENTNKNYNYSKLFNDGVSLDAQAPIKNIVFELENIKLNSFEKKDYKIKVHTWTIDEVINKIYTEFNQRNWEGVVLKIGNDLYTKEEQPPKYLVKEMIIKSLEPRGININQIEEKNVQRILSSFTTILRKSNKKIEYKTIYNSPFITNTSSANKENIGLSNFRRTEYSLFLSSDYKEDVFSAGQKEVISYFIEDESYPKSSSKTIKEELFKTPYNFVVSVSLPEKRFIEELTKLEVAKKIDSWIKSKNKGLYSIDYSIKAGGENSKNREYKVQSFNPDFFIKVIKNDCIYILVNEIKADKDICLENRAKYKYAKKHFEILNEKLLMNEQKTIYIFHMLSPESYSAYFEWLKDGRLFDKNLTFKCELENLLEEQNLS